MARLLWCSGLTLTRVSTTCLELTRIPCAAKRPTIVFRPYVGPTLAILDAITLSRSSSHNKDVACISNFWQNLLTLLSLSPLTPENKHFNSWLIWVHHSSVIRLDITAKAPGSVSSVDIIIVLTALCRPNVLYACARELICVGESSYTC